MATLAISVAAAPYRALLEGAEGYRMAVRGLEDGPNDGVLTPAVFVDSYGAEVGKRALQAAAAAPGGQLWRPGGQITHGGFIDADGTEWTGRDMFALLFRRVVQAAERSGGEAISRLLIVTPSALSAQEEEALEAAALLAGAPSAELIDMGRLMIEAAGENVGQRRLLIHLDADQMRVAVFRAGARGAIPEGHMDQSDNWSGEAITREIVDRLRTSSVDERSAHRVVSSALADWGARSSYELLANNHGSPIPVYLPGQALAQTADRLVEQIAAAVSRPGRDIAAINQIHLHGRLAPGLQSRIRRIAPGARITSDTSSAALLELLSGLTRPRPALSMSIFADHPAGTRVAPAGEARVPLASLIAHAPLPAVFVDESFPTFRYMGAVGFFGQASAGAPIPLGEVRLPRLLERRSYGRLRVSVRGETDRVLLLDISLGFGDSGSTLLYRKDGVPSEGGTEVSTGNTTIVPRRVMEALEQLEPPVRRREFVAPPR